jgi:carbon-monoxide dehydrogenase small subunit/xanthine dehydrogenase small subunit
MLAAEPTAIPLAGGTDIMVNWPQRLSAHQATYIDLSGVGDLRSIRWTDDALVLGAMTTYWDVIEDAQIAGAFPMLLDAARQVGAVQIQSRGTWAGNIANASPAADGVPVLMAYDAIVVLESATGRDEVPLAEFYLGYKQLRRRPDQLVTEVRIPRRSYRFHRFEKIGPRRAQAITKVGVAITHGDQGWHVVANSVAPTVCRCPAIERRLAAGALAGPDEILGALRDDISPIDDIRSTARYREAVLARLIYHATQDAASSLNAPEG